MATWLELTDKYLSVSAQNSPPLAIRSLLKRIDQVDFAD
jgi:hypothetical protein